MTADEDDASESLKAAVVIREAVMDILRNAGNAGIK